MLIEQDVRHAVPDAAQANPPVQFPGVPGRHAFAPLHAEAGVSVEPLHVAPPEHSPSGFCPSGIARQRPLCAPVFAIEHAAHTPGHIDSQHTLSTQ